jgi:hypothetical protein
MFFLIDTDEETSKMKLFNFLVFLACLFGLGFLLLGMGGIIWLATL